MRPVVAKGYGWQAACPPKFEPNQLFKKAFCGRRHQVSGDEHSEIVGDLFMKPAKADWLYNFQNKKELLGFILKAL